MKAEWVYTYLVQTTDETLPKLQTLLDRIPQVIRSCEVESNGNCHIVSTLDLTPGLNNLGLKTGYREKRIEFEKKEKRQKLISEMTSNGFTEEQVTWVLNRFGIN